MPRRGAAPDYTNAFLVSAFALGFVALAWIWAAFGFIPALAVAWLADRSLTLRLRGEPVRVRADVRR